MAEFFQKPMRFITFIREAAEAAKKPKKPSTSAKGRSSAADKKLEDKHVAITFGRFNPPHAGHGKLLDAVKAHGGDSGNYRIYPSRSQDHKKNPLSAQQKVDHMRKMFKGHKDAIQNNEAHRNIFDILRDLHDEGHEHVTMVVGDDRVKEFEKLANKYNGLHYDFKSINIKSAGARATDSDDPIENLSASAMRKHAQGGDHDSFHIGTGGYKDSKKLMADVIQGMTPPPKAKKGKKGESVHESVWTYAPKLDFDAFRDYYMLNQIYKVGAIVEHDDSGVIGKIVHRGPNYIIMEDGLGGEHRAWLQHVTEMTDAETQAVAADTTKDQSNYSADDGSGNTWKAGTDRYREALQNMTPGQKPVKFSEFNASIRKTAETK
jgi:nicotinic acid mononucleotide adenylyltransferase